MRISRAKSGLPRIIPRYHRKLISLGNKTLLKYYLTVFSLYRDINCQGQFKLNTITDPSTATSSSKELISFVPSFVDLFFNEKERCFPKGSLFQMFSSGPQASRESGIFNTHIYSLMRSFILFQKDKNTHLRESLLDIIDLTNNSSLLHVWDLLSGWFRGPRPSLITGVKDFILNTLIQYDRKVSYGSLYKPKSGFLGRLAIKVEAAGKIRVFAMVDPWTQWAL